MIPSPVQPYQRIQYLDILRGFAITGVLIAYIFWNLGNAPETTYTLFDKILNQAGYFLIDSKCYTILACLFTFGFVLHMDKSDDRERSLYVYRRRLLGLLIIGLLHAVLLRNGDILAPYAILTFLVTFLYKSSSRTIIIAMIIVFFLPMVLSHVFRWWGISLLTRPETSGGNYWIDNFAWLKYWYSTAILFWEGTLLLLLGGLLLGKIFIQNRKKLSDGQIEVIAFAGFFAALFSYLVLYFYSAELARLPEFGNTRFVSGTAFQLLRLIHKAGMAAAYAGVFFLLARKIRLSSLVALGRTSLSNYILQAIIVVPTGLLFDLFDHITPSIALMMAILIWAVQVLFSRWWLQQYRFGPLEWVLRWFTYGKSMAAKKEKRQMKFAEIPLVSSEP